MVTEVQPFLGKRPVTIGRSQDTALQLDEEAASRLHGSSRRARPGGAIRDLRSRNSTQLGGERIIGETGQCSDDEIQVEGVRLSCRA